MFNELVEEIIEKTKKSEMHISTVAQDVCSSLTIEDCEIALRESGGIRSEKRLAKKIERARVPEAEQDRFTKYTIKHLRGDVATIAGSRAQKEIKNVSEI